MNQKTPIVGRLAKSGEVKTFRAEKLDLKAQGYPALETQALVRKYLVNVVDKLKGIIDDKTMLVPVPSGSGMNMITEVLAYELKHRFGAGVIGDGVIMKKHRLEAKTALSLDKRLNDPIGYGLYQKALKDQMNGYSKVVIVDDLIGSGESSVKLKKVLEAYGVKVDALVNLVTVETRYPTITDLNRVMEKVCAHKALTPAQKEQFWKDLDVVFSGYTRQKLNRVEREIKTEFSAVGAYDVITKAARLEREIGKELKKQVQLTI